MGYAILAESKYMITEQLNYKNLDSTVFSIQQQTLATNTLSLQQQLTAIQSEQSTDLSALYQELAQASSSEQRSSINAKINKKKSEYESRMNVINNNIYAVEIKDDSIDTNIKRLDTQITALQKQLDEIVDAEGDAIDRATPRFEGVG